MTFFDAVSLGPIRQIFRVSTLAMVTVWPYGPLVAAQTPTFTATVPNQAPIPVPLSVSKIDFKRGQDGAGRLILQFNDNGASPDLKTQGDSVLVDLGNIVLPETMQHPIDVVDFATPVQVVDTRSSGKRSQLVIQNKGEFEALAYQSGKEYVVEIAPRVAAAVGGVSSDSVDRVAAKISHRGYTGRPVTFNFQDVPVRTVLQLIAEESKLNVVAADSVQGSITLRLVNVPWDQALDMVLRAKGLDKRRDGNVIWVAPQPELARYEQDKEDARIAIENRQDLANDYIHINYHSATAIYHAITEAKGLNGGSGGGGGAGQSENGFLSSRGRLVVDERSNTLMISDIPKKIAQMRELVSVIDRPVDQVLIESRIVVATDSFARELGSKFGVTGSRDNKYYFSGNVDANHSNIAAASTSPRTLTSGLNWNLPSAASNNPGSLALSILNAGYLLDLELSAMQQESRGEVISNPRIVTTNQREALIKQGKEIGYATITGGGAAGGAATPNVQFKEVVLELRVTPTITNDNRVFLNMNVKKDDVERYIVLAGYGSVPVINRREINTAALVEDGQTVVIGGVYEFTDRTSVTKVPFLGDVPFLGNLFKMRGKNKDKAELLVFVTPKVLRVSAIK